MMKNDRSLYLKASAGLAWDTVKFLVQMAIVILATYLVVWGIFDAV